MIGDRPKCVLLIDSDIVVRHALAQYLRHCGYKVIEAANTDEAQALLADAAVTFDFALCDAGASGSANVFDLGRLIRSRRPDAAFVLSGNPEKKAAAAADICEQAPELARPYEHQQVLAHLKRLMAARAGKSA
jgi:DNA-binding NtrC family response regulator